MVDAAEGSARNRCGTTAAPEAPGLGVTPKLDLLGEPLALYG